MIYLDYAATHPMTPAALAAYAEAAVLPGNPSSVHIAGQQAREKLEEGRSLLAGVFGVDPRRLTLNSGGTEGDNAVLLGTAQAYEAQHGRPGHLVTTAAEHSAVLAPARRLAERGWEVTFLWPSPQGLIEPEQLQSALRPHTALVSIHHAGNETGAVQPTAQLAAIARSAGVPYHADGVQAPGVLPVGLEDWGVTYATFSAHKWGGPRGVGVLYSARGHDLPPQQIGGGQEAGQRAGTQNTAGVYAAGVALREAALAQPATFAHLTELRRAFVAAAGDLPGLRWNHPADGPHSSPKVASLTLSGTDGEALLMNLDMAGICASAGSACSAGTMQPSHVLLALGLSEADARSSLRFSFGAATTLAEVEEAARVLRQVAEWSQRG